MGRWLGDGDDHFDDEDQCANAQRAEQEKRCRKEEEVHAAEQVQIEEANTARRAANEEFQMLSQIVTMLEKEKFVRWYEDKFVPLYVKDRQTTKEEVMDDLKRLIR